MKKALITGITGQDGSYLTELLLNKDYEVYGIERRVAIEDQSGRNGRINHIINDINLMPGDIRDYSRIFQVINEVKPDELYHLAAQSFVAESFDDEDSVIKINIEGTKNVLNALLKINPDCRFYFAGSSEMFGKVEEEPQNEKTPFHPRSPYGISKVAGFDWTRLYREAYGLFACSGILFNHESPRRGKEFVTRKITSTLNEIVNKKTNELVLGNIDAKRDWGFSGDYVEAMWLMLQQSQPDDYVIATGETHTIKEFLDIAFSYAGLNWKDYVKIDQKYCRPADVNTLIGDYSKAKRVLGWEPKIRFKELVEMMVEADL